MTHIPADQFKTIVRIEFPGGERLGRGKMQLLQHIRDTGSIAAAGRAMGMSYRRAWQLVDAMNSMFSQAVVESKRGGQHGGGATLTAFGEVVLDRFHAMERSIREALKEDIAWLAANARDHDDARG